MNVCICTNGIFPHAVGGIQRHSRLLVEALAQKNVCLGVIHPHAGENIFKDVPQVEEFVVPPLATEKNYLLASYQYSKNVLDVVRQRECSVVYSQGFSIWAGIREVQDRLIVNPHGLEPFQAIGLKNKLIGLPFRLVQSYVFRRAERVVSLGGKLTDILRRHVDEERIAVIPNAVELPQIDRDGSTPRPRHLLFVGRFAANKGIHILMNAVRELNQRGFEEDLVFDLVGKGPLFDEYKAKYQASNVNFLGFVNDQELHERYESCDALLLPTLYEGMPTVVLEAMSYGKPVIVTDVGATRELVDSSNGYVIPKNNAEELVKAIVSFYELSDDEKRALGEASRRKVEERFVWEAVADEYLKLFRSVKESRMKEVND